MMGCGRISCGPALTARSIVPKKAAKKVPSTSPSKRPAKKFPASPPSPPPTKALTARKGPEAPQLWVGTSGYSYKEWKGSFYPEKLPVKQMLAYYASQFPTVESNDTFRGIPKPEALEGRAAQVPDTFRFALKAPQAITHFKRLNHEAATVAVEFFGVAATLQKRLGPILLQLPPNFKKDLAKLEAFLSAVPSPTKSGCCLAFEFRHESWMDAEGDACLKSHQAALVWADSDDGPVPPPVATTTWGYLRLRREAYTRKDLSRWLADIRKQPWTDAFIYFKHEETGTGPRYGRELLELAEGGA